MPEPDWRNPDSYAYQNDLNLHEWAWEFLRRNREYRKAYFVWEELAMRTGRFEPRGKADAPRAS